MTNQPERGRCATSRQPRRGECCHCRVVGDDGSPHAPFCDDSKDGVHCAHWWSQFAEQEAKDGL